jgi:signal transduction histidine kinase
MGRTGLLGDGRLAAGRQGAALFVLAGLLALAGATLPHSRPHDLVTIAIADGAVGATAWLLPWDRWAPLASLALAVPAFGILAFSTWAVGGVVTGTGPFFVLVYVWLALHHPPWTVFATVPLAVGAYLVPLAAAHQPPEVLGSAIVLVPVAVAVGWVIVTRVRDLQRAHAHISRTERWRASLMTTLAHDVRAPLSSVQVALEMMDEDAEVLSAVERHSLIGAALRQSGRIRRLADALLDMERVDRGVLRLDLSDICVAEAAGAAVETLVSHEVTIDLDPALRVRADRDRLEQILVNLAGNGLRHGVPPVVITAERSDATVRISVRDHGKGVPESVRPALFEQFTTGEADTGGVGLGLWIVRELARIQGGDVCYEDADPGARFVVTLPAAEVPASSQMAGSTPASGSG